MRLLLPFVIALAACCAAAQAQERPRAPLAIGRELSPVQMSPPFLDRGTAMPGGLLTQQPKGIATQPIVMPVLAAADVRIVNGGATPFAMSFWDGASKWTTFTIAPGASYNLACATCPDAVQIAYHDGTANKRAEVSKGSSYLITSSANAWVLQKQAAPAP